MSDTQIAPIQPPPSDPMPQVVSQTTNLGPAPGAVDEQRRREEAYFQRKLQADDAARAQAQPVTLVATASFTLVDDPDRPAGRLIAAGQEFMVSAADLTQYLGRGVPKSLQAGAPGVTVEHNQP